MYEQRKNSSQIIANLTPQGFDEQEISPSQKLQTQLSVQDTIQRHFCQILKNDSLTVTDNTSITETILMRESSSSGVITSSMFEQRAKEQLTPDISVLSDKYRDEKYEQMFSILDKILSNPWRETISSVFAR